jgi:RHS repeat-associated protein
MGLLEQVTLSGTDSKDKNISKYFYNNAGVQIKMYTGMSSENDSTYLTTNYEYDNWLRAVRTTDSTGYNSGTITYDLNGNVLTNTDANGNITTNTYDALNRVLTSKTVNSKDSSKNVSKSYEYDNMGRISRAITNDLTTTYSYDDLGRKSEEIESKDGYSTFKGFFYEGVSQYTRQQIVGINNLLMYSYTSYEYDGEMRLIKVKETGEETVSYTYDRNGNKKSETLANGVISTYDYNNANRIVKLVNKKGNSTISSYEYSYYLDGSDACKVHSENGIIETTEYEYDGLKRLTQESVAIGNSTDTYAYEYDDYGNRSKMTAAGSENYVTEYNYNNAQGNYIALLQKEVKTVEGEENPLDLNSNVKQTVYTYDANGNQITKTAEGKTETNTYDGLNQLIGFTDGETTASYKYNASGLRYEKTVNGETINHVWDGNQQIVADVIDNQFYEADCYIRGTNLVAKYNYWNGKKTEYTYYTQNAHGDVVNLTDKDGKVTKRYRYDAFGVEKNIDENDANAFRYCGEYYDKETATVYLRARYYDPDIGRFMSRDSVTGKNEDPLSLNLYTYCANNPIYYSDPTGHIFVLDDVAIGIGVIAAACIIYSSAVCTNATTSPKKNISIDSRAKAVIGASLICTLVPNWVLSTGKLLADNIKVPSCQENVKINSKFATYYDIGGYSSQSDWQKTSLNMMNQLMEDNIINAANNDIYLDGQSFATSVKTLNELNNSIVYAKKSKKSGKEMASDIPSWARGEKPLEGESGKDFARRLCDDKYGKGNYDTGPGSEYNKLRKYGDRGFN